MERGTDRHTDVQIYRQTNVQKQGETYRPTGILTDIQGDTKRDLYTDVQTHR